jgi:hypothetical protein
MVFPVLEACCCVEFLRVASYARAAGLPSPKVERGKEMKVHVEVDMTPDEARRFMGLPDVAPLQAKMVAEMERRMKAAMNTADPEAMMKAWMPLGGEGLQQFQKFMWDSATRAASGTSKKDASKR